MFNFFKKKTQPVEKIHENYEVELTASILAYEIARSDGDISESELSLLYDEIKKISAKVSKKEEKILEIIEEYSKNSVSFYEFIDDINKDYSKEDKLSLIQFLYDEYDNHYPGKCDRAESEKFLKDNASFIDY